MTSLAFMLGGVCLGLSASLALNDRRLTAVALPIVLIVALAILLAETV